MRARTTARRLVVLVFVVVSSGAKPGSGSLPPGRPYLLTIEGENNVMFLPELRLDPARIEYRAKVEYLVNTRSLVSAEGKGTDAPKKAPRKVVAGKGKGKEKGAAAADVVGAVDVALHSTEMRFQQGGQTTWETRVSRSRFQGRFQPEAPVLNVSYNEAPLALQELLKTFDSTAATVLLDDRANVVGRKVRSERPLHAVVETLLSIHTPIPTDVAFWEAPTQLAMGQGQTAKGSLRFEKEKGSAAAQGGLVKVKVSGLLKAEGAIAGRFVKNGTYTVSGEQNYETATRQWRSAHWSVVVATELANDDGLTVARTAGNMRVESKSLDGAGDSSPNP